MVVEGLVSLKISSSTNLDVVLVLNGQILHGLPGLLHRLLLLVLVVEGIELLGLIIEGDSRRVLGRRSLGNQGLDHLVQFGILCLESIELLTRESLPLLRLGPP